MGLHYEILSAAQAAAESLLALGRKLKRMRDSGGYRHLGFESFEQYTETAVGIRQRQAYNYINVVEKVPAQLVEENSAAGITKLALLAKLGPADQRELAPELAQITVKELQALIAEKEGLAQQLSILQAEPTAVAEGSEVDLEAIRTQAAEEVREQLRAEADNARIIAVDAARRAAKEEARKEMEAELQKIREEAALERKEQEDANAAAQRYKAECNRRAEDQARLEGLLKSEREKHRAALKKEKDRAMELANKEAEKKIQQAAAEARRLQEQEDAARLDQAKKEAQAAEKTMEELKLKADPDSARFMLLFEQLQSKCSDLMALACQITQSGQVEKAEKLKKAMAGALRALADQAEEN